MVNVEGTAVLPGVVLLLPSAAAHFVDFPDARRLSGEDGLSADFGIEQAADGQGIVADELGFEPVARASGEQAVGASRSSRSAEIRATIGDRSN